MANRRDVLKMGAVLPVASLVAAPFARALGAGQSLPLERFVFDVRFAESGAIAEHVERLGIALSPVADDLRQSSGAAARGAAEVAGQG